jgi:hypothetical protein
VFTPTESTFFLEKNNVKSFIFPLLRKLGISNLVSKFHYLARNCTRILTLGLAFEMVARLENTLLLGARLARNTTAQGFTRMPAYEAPFTLGGARQM